MYEFKGGTGRIVYALQRAAADPERSGQLADLLYYYEDQLKQDITAAVDFYEAFQDAKKPDASERGDAY